MSLTSGRIADFLSRAQNINDKSKALELCKPVLNPLRTLSSSPISMKKSELSPISHQSFTSTHDNTPIPLPRKFVLSGSVPHKKNISVPPPSKLDKLQPRLLPTKERTESPSKRDSISSESSSKRPEKINPSSIKSICPSPPPQVLHQTQQIKAIESKGKKKLQKIVEIFKQEAIKTDSKLQSLQQENKRLKELASNSQRPRPATPVKSLKDLIEYYAEQETNSKFDNLLENLCKTCRRIVKTTEDYEKKIPNWFESLEIKSLDFDEFLKAACRKVLIEEKRSIRVKEESERMIENEENCIRELELRIFYAERLVRIGSCRAIESVEFEEEEEMELDREAVLRNLDLLIGKKKDLARLGQ